MSNHSGNIYLRRGRLTRYQPYERVCVPQAYRPRRTTEEPEMSKQTKLAIAAMRMAQRRGCDPYNSADMQAKMYRCVWSLAR